MAWQWIDRALDGFRTGYGLFYRACATGLQSGVSPAQIMERRIEAVMTAMVRRKKIRMTFFMALPCLSRKTAARPRDGS